MDGILFIKSLLIGLSIAAPVGPIGLLCIQRTLGHGARIGFISGLGAATADGLYGALGALGTSALTQAFVALAQPLALFGAIFLAWMGAKLLRNRHDGEAREVRPDLRPWPAFASVLGLTLTNPMTILSFVAIFAAIGGGAPPQAASVATMLVGVFAGSAAWWLTLALGVATARRRVTPALMVRIDQVAGIFLIGFAVWQLTRALTA